MKKWECRCGHTICDKKEIVILDKALHHFENAHPEEYANEEDMRNSICFV